MSSRSIAHISTQIARSESGISMLEFTIVLPLIILLITGLVQLGNAYHELQVLEDALRHGARLAAEVSKPGSAVLCATLTSTATTGVRRYLNQNGLDPNLAIINPSLVPWTITAKNIKTNFRVEGGVTIHFIELTGRKNPRVSNCLFCPNRILSNILPSATASFAIRGSCT